MKNKPTKVTIYYYNPVTDIIKTLFEKEVDFDEYMKTEPLKYCEKLVTDDVNEASTIYISTDASVGIYRLKDNYGYLIQQFEHLD